MDDPKLGDFLNSINDNKKNIIREGGAPEVAEKLYVPFIVSRTLSYHADAILFVNELNYRSKPEHNLSDKMHYEYLLYTLPKRKRWTKWAKQEKEEDVRLVMAKYKYSYERAMEVLDILGDDGIEALKRGEETGGAVNTPKKKKSAPRGRR